MARPRTYHHDLRCPHCGSNWTPQYGHSRGKQTYRCGDCHHRFTPGGNRHYYSEEVKAQALSMYCEGISISAISRIMGIQLGTVFSWVKKNSVGREATAATGGATGGTAPWRRASTSHLLG